MLQQISMLFVVLFFLTPSMALAHFGFDDEYTHETSDGSTEIIAVSVIIAVIIVAIIFFIKKKKP